MTRQLIDDLDDNHKKLAEDIIPDPITYTTVQRVLQGLLAEMVSIRDLPTILEALSETTHMNNNAVHMIEHVRSRLARQISFNNLDDKGHIPVVTLAPEWEQLFMENITGPEDNRQVSIAPTKLQEFITQVGKKFDQVAMEGIIPILLVANEIRIFIHNILSRGRSGTTILSQKEIHYKVKIKNMGKVEWLGGDG